MALFKRIFSSLFDEGEVVRRGARHARAYAVGDIHGRLDLLEDLLELIERDCASREARKTYLIFLGDLIDRGPDSKGVVERLRANPLPGMKPVYLMGNHEEVLLRILHGEEGILWNWLRFGGAECLESYGLDPAQFGQMREPEALQLIRQAIPDSHLRFLEGFADTFTFGDYVFVHAGLRPGVALEDQKRQDLRWIREPFLTDSGSFAQLVVHGHTIVDTVMEHGSRIAIDTGAYRSGTLTAIGIEDEERWYLATGDAGGSSQWR